MKTSITVTLDSELVLEARLKHIKFSELFNNTLKTVLELGDDSSEEASLDDKIVNVKARLMSLESEKKREEEKKKKEEGRWINV